MPQPDAVELSVSENVAVAQEVIEGVADTLVLSELVKVPLPLPDALVLSELVRVPLPLPD